MPESSGEVCCEIAPLVGTLSWVQPGSCLQVLDTNKEGDIALLYVRRRLVLVEQRGLGWATGTRETQKAVARLVVKSPLVGTPSGVEPDSCLQALGTEEDGAVALPYVRRRLVLVEQRGLGWVTDRRE